jgi:hypothetical protein
LSPTDLAIRLIALAAIALHLIAGLLPEEAVWGVWPYTALPPPLGWLGALAVASLALPPVNDILGRWLHHLWVTLPGKMQLYPGSRQPSGTGLLFPRRRPAGGDKRRWFAAIAIAMAIPFWLFRIRHLRWGDSHFIVKALSYTGPDRPIWTIYNWQSPLTILIHAKLWLLLNPSLGIGVDTLYAITSVLTGVGFVYSLFLLTDSLGRDRLEKATIFGLVITTGSVQLFFGYIENYTLISLGLILTLYLGVRCLRGEISLAWPSLTLSITNAFHPSTAILWPAMGYVAWRVAGHQSSAGASTPQRRGRPSEWAKLILPPILVFAALSALMASGGHGPGAMLVDDRPGGADSIPFVPLFQVTTEWQHYTMFSLAHLLDWANEHFLISPFGLPLLLLALVSRLTRQTSAERPGGDEGIIPFVTIASLVYLFLTFVWNPDYGGRKDWDLFAPSAFVYTSLAAYLLIRHYVGDQRESPERKYALAQVARLLIAASALHTIAWIYYNTIP